MLTAGIFISVGVAALILAAYKFERHSEKVKIENLKRIQENNQRSSERRILHQDRERARDIVGRSSYNDTRRSSSSKSSLYSSDDYGSGSWGSSTSWGDSSSSSSSSSSCSSGGDSGGGGGGGCD